MSRTGIVKIPFLAMVTLSLVSYCLFSHTICAAKLQQNEPPILVLINDEPGYFGRYTGEILKAEGISEILYTCCHAHPPSLLCTLEL